MPPSPPPRQSPRPHELPPHMFAVQVVSIADYERAKASESDNILNSAVDQLETMSRSGNELPKLADLTVRFGQLELMENSEPRGFDFDLPTTCATWPGPHFGRISLHKVIAKPSKTPVKPTKQYLQRRESIERIKTPRPRPQQRKTNKKSKKINLDPKVRTSVASRDPPLHLLSLPPEIRNAFWTLLAVQKGPVEAQLRHMRPCKKPQKLQSQIVRRFPCEPVVASVNRQLRREVLSIFYGTNHFVMEKNACSLFKNLSMTSPASVQKWNPRPELANFLSSVDIRYNVMPRQTMMSSIVYMLRRLANGKVTIDVKAEKPCGKKVADVLNVCLCTEIDVIKKVRENPQNAEADLAEVSLLVMRTRLGAMFGDPSMDKTDSQMYYPPDPTCARCQKPTVEIVYSGL